MRAMKKVIKARLPRRGVFKRAFLSGMVADLSSGSLGTGYPYQSSLDALRSDWVRVGKDLDIVMTRAHGEAAKSER